MIEVPLEEAKTRLSGEGQPGGDSNTRYGPNSQTLKHSNKGRQRHRRREFNGHLLTSAEFMSTMRPPEYLIDGLLMVGRTYTLTGPTGHGKTLLALLLAIAISTGGGFCGRLCQQGSVAFFAGENPENVKMQWFAICRNLDIDPSSLPVYWYEGVFNIDQARDRLTKALRDVGDLRLCLFDSLQAFFLGEDDSQNMAMLDTAIDFRSISDAHPNRPTVIIPAHPVKNAGRDMLFPRGGSALTNELDGNLTLWRDDDIATLHWLGKFRGVPFEPLKFEVTVVKPQGLVDAYGSQISCTIMRPAMPLRVAELAEQYENRQVTALATIQANPKATLNDIAAAIGQGKTTAKRIVDTLIAAKWIKRSGHRLRLTNDGKTFLREEQNDLA